MARRLRPFDDAVFIVTISFPSSEVSGEIEEKKFHARTLIRAWSRLLQETTNLFTPPAIFTTEADWQTATVNVPQGTQEVAPVTFAWTDGNNSITAERVLQVEESVEVDVHNIMVRRPNGQDRLVRYHQHERDEEFEGNIQVNLSGGQQWNVGLKVPQRRLRVTAQALDALVNYTLDTGIEWRRTNDLGTVV